MLTAVKTETPTIPYPAETTANGWHPELHIERILTSDTWVLAEDDERPWLLRTWFECWRSVPVGSMPSDRRLFARRIGCTAQFLAAHAEVLLRGWVQHDDGKLYHQFVTGQVLQMLKTRKAGAEKLRAWREKKKAQNVTGCNQLHTGNIPVSNRQEQEQDLEQDIGDKPPIPPLSGASVPKKPRTANPRPDDVIPEGVDPQAWADFTAHRREIRKPLTQLSASKNAEVLRAMSPQQQRAAVNSTVANRWAGVFPPKGNGQAKAGKTVTVDAFREMVARGEI